MSGFCVVGATTINPMGEQVSEPPVQARTRFACKYYFCNSFMPKCELCSGDELRERMNSLIPFGEDLPEDLRSYLCNKNNHIYILHVYNGVIQKFLDDIEKQKCKEELEILREKQAIALGRNEKLFSLESTALHMAAFEGDEKLSYILMKVYGFNELLENGLGKTARRIAALGGRKGEKFYL